MGAEGANAESAGFDAVEVVRNWSKSEEAYHAGDNWHHELLGALFDACNSNAIALIRNEEEGIRLWPYPAQGGGDG